MNYELIKETINIILVFTGAITAPLCVLFWKWIKELHLARKRDTKTMAAMERAMKYMSDRMNGQTNSVTQFPIPANDPAFASIFNRAMKIFETALEGLEQQYGVTEEEVKNEGEIKITNQTDLCKLTEKQLAIALKQYEAKGEFEICSKILSELEKRKI